MSLDYPNREDWLKIRFYTPPPFRITHTAQKDAQGKLIPLKSPKPEGVRKAEREEKHRLTAERRENAKALEWIKRAISP